MESREELVVLLHFDDDAEKSERTFLGFCISVLKSFKQLACAVLCANLSMSASPSS